MNDALCRSCGSCGFPMRIAADFAGGRREAPYCSTCAEPSGQLKPFADVLEANAQYFVRHQGVDPEAGRTLARALLASMPAWKTLNTPRTGDPS
jgi:hypothetical protein